MDEILALVASIFIPISALFILDALFERRYRKVAFYIVTLVVFEVIYYLNISELPDSDHYLRYWNLALPAGVFLCTFIVTLFIFISKLKGK
jgi:hypothetical protein